MHKEGGADTEQRAEKLSELSKSGRNEKLLPKIT